MKITIIPEDNFVSIDGATRSVPMNLDDNIHAIQWDGEKGFVEQKKGGSRKIDDLQEFQNVIDSFERLVQEEIEEFAAAAPERALVAFRGERDSRLKSALDKLDRHRNQKEFGIPCTITDVKASEWAIYAQILRDLPVNTNDPVNPIWPDQPE